MPHALHNAHYTNSSFGDGIDDSHGFIKVFFEWFDYH